MENYAENVQPGTVQVGTPVMAPAEQPQTLADVIRIEEAPAAQQPPSSINTTAMSNDTPTQQQEPGWFQGRLQKEQAKWEKKHEAEMAQLRDSHNSLMERMIARDAKDLVDSGEFKSIERATEYLRMKEGLPVQQQPAPVRQRDEHGRFVPTQNDQPDADAMQQARQRADVLVTQADVIHSVSGVDVMAIYNTDPNVRQKVLSGEWDFKDVLKNHQPQANQQRAVPPPIRSSSGVGIGNASISRMNDASFKAMNDLLTRGGVIDMRR